MFCITSLVEVKLVDDVFLIFTITCGLNIVDVISVINYVIDNRKLWSGFVK